MHTGAKSAGCENRIAQLLPIQLWKSISPCVVFAWRFGAVLPSLIRGWSPADVASVRVCGKVDLRKGVEGRGVERRAGAIVVGVYGCGDWRLAPHSQILNQVHKLLSVGMQYD